MKLVNLCFLFVFVVGFSSIAQDQFKNHYVKKGETVYSIAREYGITIDEIYRLNPDVKNGVKQNTLLIIPTNNGTTSIESVSIKVHRVKRKETLYSISQIYNVSVDDIKKYNKELYSRDLKKGEKIEIPVPIKKTTIPANETIEPTLSEHKVEPKETKFGIARMYGITIAELEELNPALGESVQIGTILNVPNVKTINTAILEDGYDFYVVQPKEGFFRLKVKLGLTEEEIIDLNPYAKNGLKDGMILKIKKENLVIADLEKILPVNLKTRIINKNKKNLVVLLPFQLNKVGQDSISSDVELLKRDGTLRVALDFYSGVLMAAEFAKDIGISVNINVNDTEGSEAKTSEIISSHSFDEIDAVIGPLLQKNVEKAAALLHEMETPIFSPLSNREMKLYSNFFQTLPTEAMLRQSMLNFLSKNAKDKNMVLISDANRSTQKASIVDVLHAIKNITPKAEGFLHLGDIESKLIVDRENWVILESANPGLISNVLGLLNRLPKHYQLRLITLYKNEAYDYHDISNMYLAKLNFTFPSVNKSYKNPFLISYKNRYGVYPNRYAVRGFDITYDILLRLGSSDDIYDSVSNNYLTEYVENKFRYTKNGMNGYQNQATYILKYTENLEFEIVE